MGNHPKALQGFRPPSGAFLFEGGPMYLENSETIGEVVSFGIKPAIELINMSEDLHDIGEDDRIEFVVGQVKALLCRIKKKLESIELQQPGRGGTG
jgi:hypothetical protein